MLCLTAFDGFSILDKFDRNDFRHIEEKLKSQLAIKMEISIKISKSKKKKSYLI